MASIAQIRTTFRDEFDRKVEGVVIDAVYERIQKSRDKIKQEISKIIADVISKHKVYKSLSGQEVNYKNSLIAHFGIVRSDAGKISDALLKTLSDKESIHVDLLTLKTGPRRRSIGTTLKISYLNPEDYEPKLIDKYTYVSEPSGFPVDIYRILLEEPNTFADEVDVGIYFGPGGTLPSRLKRKSRSKMAIMSAKVIRSSDSGTYPYELPSYAVPVVGKNFVDEIAKNKKLKIKIGERAVSVLDRIRN